MTPNRLFYGDNLDVLREHVPDESVDLVYLDPPFNSNRNYNVIFARHDTEPDATRAQIQAFDDTWRWTPAVEEQYQDAIAGGLPNTVADALTAMRTLLGENDAMAYLTNMAPRLVELHRVLKPSGSLYLHCDPTMSHYLKILLDATFGAENFRNEIVWKRTGAHGAAKKYAPVHDVILCYVISPAATWNPTFHQYSPDYLAVKYRYEDEKGRYRLITLFPPGTRKGETGKPWRGVDPTAKDVHWRYPPSRLEELDAEGMIYWGAKGAGLPQLKRYLDISEGVAVQDVWTDISPINSQAKERLGYPTQKPLALLERIIEASSIEGDVILDPFCGCGTAIDAAVRMGRRWIGIDITYIAVDLIVKRLRHRYGPAITDQYEVLGIPRDLGAAKALFERSPFEFERWAVSLVHGTPNQKQVGDRGVDGVIRFFADPKASRVGRVLVSVKGGKSVGPQYVRDLVGTVRTQKAEMGSLISLASSTRGVRDALDHAGSYTWPINGRAFPLAQAATVEELLGGRRLDTPPPLLPYIAADRHQHAYDQLALDVG